MTCYHPIKGYKKPGGGMSHARRTGYEDRPVTIACGQCIGCRIDRSQQWAIRCYHEASMHDDNCFVTLTYDEAHVPADYSINVRHFQLFMKKIRKKHGSGIRFFHCGEYGDQNKRPHYHAILFGLDFNDKELVRDGKNKLYTSPTLSKHWPWGYASVGAATYQSSAYVARYILKKITGKRAETHYTWKDPDGKIRDHTPEYATMSRRPGLGKTWLDKYVSDVFPSDFIIVDGKKRKVPKYYNDQIEVSTEPKYRAVRMARHKNGKQNSGNHSPQRLQVREKIAHHKQDKIERNL